METSLNTFAREGLVPKKNIKKIMGRISMSQSLEEGASDADIAFETVVENKDTKYRYI